MILFKVDLFLFYFTDLIILIFITLVFMTLYFGFCLQVIIIIASSVFLFGFSCYFLFYFIISGFVCLTLSFPPCDCLDYVNLLLPALSSTNSHKHQTVTLQPELMLYLFTFPSCLRLCLSLLRRVQSKLLHSVGSFCYSTQFKSSAIKEQFDILNLHISCEF